MWFVIGLLLMGLCSLIPALDTQSTSGGSSFWQMRAGVAFTLAGALVYISRVEAIVPILGVSLGWPAMRAIIIFSEIAADPTSNNLWPIELFIIICYSAIPAFVGGQIGKLIRKKVRGL